MADENFQSLYFLYYYYFCSRLYWYFVTPPLPLNFTTSNLFPFFLSLFSQFCHPRREILTFLYSCYLSNLPPLFFLPPCNNLVYSFLYSRGIKLFPFFFFPWWYIPSTLVFLFSWWSVFSVFRLSLSSGEFLLISPGFSHLSLCTGLQDVLC